MISKLSQKEHRRLTGHGWSLLVIRRLPNVRSHTHPHFWFDCPTNEEDIKNFQHFHFFLKINVRMQKLILTQIEKKLNNKSKQRQIKRKLNKLKSTSLERKQGTSL